MTNAIAALLVLCLTACALEPPPVETAWRYDGYLLFMWEPSHATKLVTFNHGETADECIEYGTRLLDDLIASADTGHIATLKCWPRGQFTHP